MRPIIEDVRTYLCGFPGLRDGLFGVDYLGSEPTGYTVEAVPCDPVLRQYTDGSAMKQFLFVFASRETYGPDVTENTANMAFYEALERWLRANDDRGVLPVLDGREACGIEVLTSGYVLDADSSAARYQMQVRLTYLEEVI